EGDAGDRRPRVCLQRQQYALREAQLQETHGDRGLDEHHGKEKDPARGPEDGPHGDRQIRPRGPRRQQRRTDDQTRDPPPPTRFHGTSAPSVETGPDPSVSAASRVYQASRAHLARTGKRATPASAARSPRSSPAPPGSAASPASAVPRPETRSS